MNETREYSIVIPVYNSEFTLNELHNRITKVFEKVTDNYEIIFVDDCSRDNSWNILKEIHSKDKRVKIIHLIKNFGQNNAIFCGLNHSCGKYVVTMDDDLQHPPEEIPKLIEKIKQGYFVVYGRFPVKYHNKVENFLGRRTQYLNHKILGIPDDIFISSFVIYSSNVISNVKLLKISHIFLPAMISTIVPINKIFNVDVEHKARKIGASNYTLSKYISITLNLILNYSTVPLTFVGVFGGSVSIISFILGFFIIVQKILDPAYGLAGWTSLMVMISFLCGIILISLAIVGEYLVRILAEISYAKPYIIEEIYV
jgi:glycosyltransferase involved in cell wall biosynthesis